MNKLRLLTKFPTAPLILIVVVSFAIRAYNLGYNSPFLDEAQYLVLGKKVLAGHWQEANPFSWVGGMPLFYPPLSAFFGNFGILGARLLNVLLGTFSVYIMYEFAKSLVLSSKEKTNEMIGLVSAGFLGVLAVPIYLSRLAIYDMLSFTLLLLGLAFLQKALVIKNAGLMQRENKFFLAAVAFFLSFLAKYVTIIFFPLVLLWALYQSRKLGKKVFSTFLSYFAAPLVIATTAYLALNFNELRHFLADQVGDSQNRSMEILSQFGTYTLIPTLFAASGALTLLFKKKFSIVVALLLASLLPLAVHLASNSLPAAHQHTFLSIIFIIPAAAYFFGLFLEKRWLIGRFIVLLALTITFVYSQNQVRELESSWPNTNAVMTNLKASTTNHEKLLSFEDDVTKLFLTNLDEKNISGVFDFKYKELSGEKAYQQALKEGYFNFILFNDDTDNETANTVKNSVTKHYIPQYNEHPFVVYKLNEK